MVREERHCTCFPKTLVLGLVRQCKLEEPKNLTKLQLIRKLRALHIHAIVLVGRIGDWYKLDDLGKDDPFRDMNLIS